MSTVPWPLDPALDHLNHGAFGGPPTPVLDAQNRLRLRIEASPTQFLGWELEAELDRAREALARFVGADPAGLVFVANATTGINAVLRSLRLAPGDELVVTDHEYNACRNALDFVAERSGARVVVAEVPFPLEGPEQVRRTVMERVGGRTRLVLLDHVTSPTALVLPVEAMVAELEPAGVPVLVDGAHGPGMLPLDVEALGASYYAGNCHKWMCSARGAGFLWAREDRRHDLAPVVISHGWNDPREDRPRLHKLFDWTGSADPTAWLTVPVAIETVGSLVEGGWDEVMRRNRSLAVEARSVLCEALGVGEPAPEDMLGSMAAVPLPGEADGVGIIDPLTGVLAERYRFDVPVFLWGGRRVLRVSAQLHNRLEQYERLAEAVAKEVL